jgi:hypothetical protein
MGISTIFLFFIYTWGLGYTFTRFIRGYSLEIFFMRIGIGLGVFCILGVFLNLIKIPLDWKVFLLLSLLMPVYDFSRKIFSPKKEKLIRPSKTELIVLLIFVLTFFIYCKGAFTNPWLEDDDSWFHAAGIKYISIEKTLNDSFGKFLYLDPYPPGYDLIFGILHQTSLSLYWTLKFFNILIISLSILFFFFFAKQLANDDKKALFSTFVLASIPSYLSHFIWSHALALTLFFPAFYCLIKLTEDKRFFAAAMLVIGGILVVDPTQAFKFVVMLFLFFVAWSIVNKKFQTDIFLTSVAGCILSLLWWVPALIRYAHEAKPLLDDTLNFVVTNQHETTNSTELFNLIKDLFSPSSGSATRVYRIEDFIWPPTINMINNPIGIGVVVSILAAVGIYICLKSLRGRDLVHNLFCLTALVWFLFTFLGVNSMTFHLPVGLFAFRFWMLLAIPVSLLAAEAFTFILSRLKLTASKIIFTVAAIVGILFSSAFTKYDINTGRWSFGIYWTSMEEMKGYSLLRENLRPNTKVFSFSDNFFVIGFDMDCDFWKPETINFSKNAINMDLASLSSWLKKHDYEYIIVGQREIKKFGAKAVGKRIHQLSTSKLFRLEYNFKNAVFIFKLV